MEPILNNVFSNTISSTWVLFFYTTYCNLGPLQAGLIFAAARILDAVASPLIGYLSDHADSTRLGRRFGRRGVFLLIAIPNQFWPNVGEWAALLILFILLTFSLN